MFPRLAARESEWAKLHYQPWIWTGRGYYWRKAFVVKGYVAFPRTETLQQIQYLKIVHKSDSYCNANSPVSFCHVRMSEIPHTRVCVPSLKQLSNSCVHDEWCMYAHTYIHVYTSINVKKPKDYINIYTLYIVISFWSCNIHIWTHVQTQAHLWHKTHTHLAWPQMLPLLQVGAVTSNQLSALGWRLFQLSLTTVRLPLLWLVLLDEDVHVDFDHVLSAQTPWSTLAIVNPALRGKICALSAVKAMVEPSMIAKRKGYNEVSGILSYLVGRNRKEMKEREERGREGGRENESTLTLPKGMECCLSMEGENNVILWRRKLEHSSKLSGKNVFASLSSRSPWSGGMPYLYEKTKHAKTQKETTRIKTTTDQAIFIIKES